MPFDGSGTFSRVHTWATEAASPPIEIEKLDTQEADIATALSNCVLRDGTGLPTATIDWNSQGITNLASLNGVSTSGGFARLSLQNTFLAGQIISSTEPRVYLLESDASANNKTCSWGATAETVVGTLHDDGIGSADWYVLNRTGTTADSLNYQVTSLQYNGLEVGFRGIPQNSQSSNYTCVLADAGKHVYASGSLATITIPAEASVNYPVGTELTFVNNTDDDITIAITSDTMVLAGTVPATTGSRTLSDNGVAKAMKVDSSLWFISNLGGLT